MGKLKELIDRTKKGWSNLSRNKKLGIGIILSSIIIASLIYYFTIGRIKYVPIFTNLDIKDSSQIVQKLDEMKISNYRIDNGGRTILVSEKEVDKLRLDLAIHGILPNSGEGFELFDDTGFAITNEDRKILYQRALEGELQRSIMTLQEVDFARVHLALSEETIFTKEVQPAKASVILNLKPFETLSPEQIRGIISLVSGAVNNLPEENVKVVDSQANLLSDGIVDQEGSFQGVQSASNRMETEAQFEKNLQDDLKDMLEQVLGIGKVLVKVNAELDLDSKEETVISYDREGVIRSQQIQINRNGSVIGGIGDSPLDNNTNYIDPNVENILEDDDTLSYSSTTNQEIGETTTYTIKAPGEVKRISTSVVYNGNLTPEMRGAIENIVMAATGSDDERGDIISVEGIPFDSSYQASLKEQLAQEQERLAQEEAARQRLMMYVGIPIGVLLAILIIYGIIRFARRRKEREEALLDVTIGQEIPQAEIEEEPIIDLDLKESTEERSIKEYAQKHPEKMAELLRAWIVEDER